MLATQSPLSGHRQLIQAPKSSRKPLQLKNNNNNLSTISNPKPKPHDLPERVDNDSNNKENVPPVKYSTPVKIKKESLPIIQSFDASLADELSAIREKLERQRIDKENNERLLRERGLMLDLQMNEILKRGEVQKQLEIEVDRLYRLKEIRLACMRISGLRSLRDKEQENKMKHHDQINKANITTQDMNEQKEETPLHTTEVV